MASGIAKIIEGAALIVGGLALEALTAGAATPIAGLMISAGAGMAISGLGTIINGSGTGRGGIVGSERNPIRPWDVCIGRFRVGGTLVYMNQWPPPGSYGGNPFQYFNIFGIGAPSQRDGNAFLDLVFVLCSHRIQSVDGVLFNGEPLPVDPTASLYAKGGGPGKITPTLGGTSYNPTQTNKQSTSISRSNGVITVVCPFDIPALQAGFPIILQDENGAQGLTDNNLAGTYIVEQIITRTPGSALTFSVLGGGPTVTIPNSTYTNAGWVTTKWPGYGRDVYVEYMLGDQILGQTFNGLIAGTPYQGTGSPVNPNFNTYNTGPGGTNPWTNACSLQGKAAVHIRLYYDAQYFSGGLPQISFLGHGKADIYDPRLGSLTGIKTATLATAGSGGYLAKDVLTVAGGTGGQITITNVDSSGNPTSWVTTATGVGYSLGGPHAASGGHGSGAEFNIAVLAGVSSGVASVGIALGGQNYNKFDILQVGGQYGTGWTYLGSGTPGAQGVFAGTMCFLEVTSTGSGGSVTGVSILQAGYGWNKGDGIPTSISGSQAAGTSYVLSYPTGGGTGCTINVLTLTNGADSSSTYSENAALVIADYLADPIWGYGATYVTPSSSITPYNNIDITALTSAANICDLQIELGISYDSSPPSPQYEPLYACNGHFDLSMRRGDVLQNLLTSCAGRFLYIGGLYSIQPGYWYGTGSPPFQVNLQAIAAGKPVWRPNVKIRELFNAVKGTYVNPSNKWEPSDFPYYAQDYLHGYNGPAQYGGDINLAVDLGQRRYKDIHLPFTISSATAQRIAKIELLRGRNQGGYGIGTGTFPLNMAGYQFVPLDVFEATFPFLGWANKILEVTAVRFKAETYKGDGVVLGTEIDVQETSADIYAWSVDEDLSPAGFQQAISPAPSVSEIVPFPWSPGAVAPLNGDALYTAGVNGPGTFSMSVVYGAETGGVGTVTLVIGGVPPINALDTELGLPFVTVYASPTGGSIAAGTYVVGISAFDGNGDNMPYLDLATVTVGGGLGVATLSLGNGGANYYTGQTAILQGGDNQCVVSITGVGPGGQVTSINTTPVNPGNGYSVGTYNTIGGSGTGLTVNIGSLTGATATGSITVIPMWGPGDNGGEIYMAMQTVSTPQYQLLASQGQLTAKNVMHYQSTMTTGQASATLTSFNASNNGGPDALFNHFVVAWQNVIHTGPWAQQVQAVTGTSGTSPGTVTISGPNMSANQWAGYTLALLSHADPEAPVQVLNMPILSNTASSPVGSLITVSLVSSGGGGYTAHQILNVVGGSGSGGQIEVIGIDIAGNIRAWNVHTPGTGYVDGDAVTVSIGTASFTVTSVGNGAFVLTIGQNAAGGQLPSLPSELSVADLVTVFGQFTFTANSFSDPNIANGYYPNGDTNTEAGHVAVVLTGADAGDVQTITSVTNASGGSTPPLVTYNIAGSWQVTPSTGDVVVICAPAAAGASVPTQSFSIPNKSNGAVTVATVNVQNLLGQVWLFTVRTETSPPTNATAPDFVHPKRLIYIPGAQNARYISYISGSPPTDVYTMQSWDALVNADCSGGSLTYNCLPASEVPNQTFTVAKIDTSANTITVNAYTGNTLSDGTTSWTGNAQGDSITFQVDATTGILTVIAHAKSAIATSPGWYPLPWTSVITPDWNNGEVQAISSGSALAPLGGNTTINNIINSPSGSGNEFQMIVTQATAAAYSITWGSAYVNAQQPSATPGAITTFTFRLNTIGQWVMVNLYATA